METPELAIALGDLQVQDRVWWVNSTGLIPSIRCSIVTRVHAMGGLVENIHLRTVDTPRGEYDTPLDDFEGHIFFNDSNDAADWVEEGLLARASTRAAEIGDLLLARGEIRKLKGK